MRKWNHNLPPFMACVETCDIRPKDAGGPPTPAELRLLCWANVVHGARGIIWFHYFSPTPPENYKAMARFLDQVTRLTPAVCGPAHTGAVKVTTGDGGRVDVMATEHAGKIHLFAVNLKRKADKVRFTVAGMKPSGKVTVFDEKRTLAADGKTFEDSFDPLGVHIYAIEKK